MRQIIKILERDARDLEYMINRAKTRLIDVQMEYLDTLLSLQHIKIITGKGVYMGRDIKDQYEEMKLEYEQFQQSIEQMELKVGEMKDRLSQMESELKEKHKEMEQLGIEVDK